MKNLKLVYRVSLYRLHAALHHLFLFFFSFSFTITTTTTTTSITPITITTNTEWNLYVYSYKQSKSSRKNIEQDRRIIEFSLVSIRLLKNQRVKRTWLLHMFLLYQLFYFILLFFFTIIFNCNSLHLIHPREQVKFWKNLNN